MEMIVTITLIRLLFKSNKHELISDQARGEDATCICYLIETLKRELP